MACPVRAAGNVASFDRWAQSYDVESNPLLKLEQRYLERLLPRVAGRDVLDAGCGSGRWLSYFATQAARTLCGIDSSSGMLSAASQKKIPGAKLIQSSCEITPFCKHSFDLILSSFVLSYVTELEAFADEMTRISRDDCDLFLSDMHPDTQMRLGWKRSFHDGEDMISLDTATHRIQDVVSILTSRGWELRAAIEPEFGLPERNVFVAAHRLGKFREAKGHPAIYVLHLQKRALGDGETTQRNETVIRGGRYVLGPQESADATLHIHNGRIAHILPDAHSAWAAHSKQIDLSGYVLMPGLINAHDHLEFALFPRLAASRYPNAEAWARDIQSKFADVIDKHRSVPKEVRLWWGGLRNLLCGVTTVCHHNPSEPAFQHKEFPVRVVREFGWAHSLAFGGDLRMARDGTPQDAPFIVHAGEGIDNASREEIFELDRMKLLDKDAVIVHGLAMDAASVRLMRRRHASLIVCPSSNYFLFGESPDIGLLSGVGKVALGSDSPLTATGDLLDEVQFAMDRCGISPRRAYSMVTDGPAEILRLRNGEGSIKPGGTADLIAIRDTHCEPANRFYTLSAADVELVMIGGRIYLASDALMERLPLSVRQGLEPLRVGETTRWLRAPIQTLLREAEDVLGEGKVRLGGKPVFIPTHPEVPRAC